MRLLRLFSSLASAAVVSAHTIITYPGWRGNNLITNETFPYGMQWMYPCGGTTVTQNRTYWPTTGGAVAYQPGWFQGHETAFTMINLGYGTDGPDGGPMNMSNPMLPIIQILGPTKNPYPGTICFPQVPLPVGANVKAGDLATIQVVELAVHGASLFSCVDIIFADPGDPRIPLVNGSNCFNSSDLGFAQVFTVNMEQGASTVPSAAVNRFIDSCTLVVSWATVAIGAFWLFL